MSARACSGLDYISRSCCLSYDNVWEIKPGTPPVIFEDVYGNEITRYAKRDLGSRLRSLTIILPGLVISRMEILFDANQLFLTITEGMRFQTTYRWALGLYTSFSPSPPPFELMGGHRRHSSKYRSRMSSFHGSDR